MKQKKGALKIVESKPSSHTKERIMIKKQILLTAVAALLTFWGCGEDRSHPKGVDADGNPIVFKNPTAVIELNATTHIYVAASDTYTVGGGARDTVGNPFIFDGLKSQDNDENNQSITNYQWSISHTFIPECVDINTTESQTVFKFINVDANETNRTCYNLAVGDGEINATLVVTDDEGKTASTTKAIITN